MTRPELVARIVELERKLKLTRNAMYRQRKRAELWRRRALNKKGAR